jgi:hypothetical protein
VFIPDTGYLNKQRYTDGNLTASNVEALDVLFLGGEKGSFREPRRRNATSYVTPLCRFWLFVIYVISVGGSYPGTAPTLALDLSLSRLITLAAESTTFAVRVPVHRVFFVVRYRMRRFIISN